MKRMRVAELLRELADEFDESNQLPIPQTPAVLIPAPSPLDFTGFWTTTKGFRAEIEMHAREGWLGYLIDSDNKRIHVIRFDEHGKGSAYGDLKEKFNPNPNY